jgi:hypothetical protein
MDSVTLVQPEETLPVQDLQASNKSCRFQNNPQLFSGRSRVQSSVILSIGREFVSELGGNAMNLTHTTFVGLQRQCEEFGFDEITVKLSEFPPAMDFKRAANAEAEARGRITALEEQAEEHSRAIAALQSDYGGLSIDFGRLAGKCQHCGLVFLD